MKRDTQRITEPALRMARICRENGLIVSDDSLRMLAHYVDLILDCNKGVNLISRNDTTNIWFSHILHSISILFCTSFSPGQRVLDLGTGGGLPGVPLSILMPDASFTLLDSIAKKTNAVQQIVSTLGLRNVLVETGRAEDPVFIKKSKPFDVVVSRAVASLTDLIRWSKPLLTRKQSASHGVVGKADFRNRALLALKGGDLDLEIKKAKLMTREKEITVIDLVFNGNDGIGLYDKKLVIVQM
ncbi:MAG: 16S rRNA (guanine(527)-N(7))-methyltransferase RsmG [Bacteroidetes bacterium]|nr:16S rRNA (guanine(527)-N(7))-methyltransferase RsmG [Bacteroidota bacterium]MCW5894603.1 16S rRNA (guanine(527)-N(7))-methyltransferase RsmG [Bacteroidota bacterium]